MNLILTAYLTAYLTVIRVKRFHQVQNAPMLIKGKYEN